MTIASSLLLIVGLASALTMCTTPVLLMAMIIPLAMLIASLINLLYSSWMALTLFLIYVGAMLVMFAYFVAMSPNQQFFPILPIMFIASPLSLASLVSPIQINVPLLSTATSMQTPFIMLFNSLPTPLFLAVILLLILIVVAKLTTRVKGPLRPFSL